MMTIAAWLTTAAAALADTSETPALDAQVLLAHVLEKPRAWLLAHLEIELTEEEENDSSAGLARLLNGEPLPYVLGHREFFGLDFTITPGVLIPRPETELLVEQGLDWLHQHPTARCAIDVGVGSGCITIALAIHAPGLRFVATDLSCAALQVARLNIIRHGVKERVDLVHADLLNAIQAETPTFHLLTANLPYIPTGTLQTLAVYGKEPELALDGGPEGINLVRRLLQQAPAFMHPESLLLLEIEHRQGKTALTLAQDAFPQAQVSILQDLTGHDRVLKIRT